MNKKEIFKAGYLAAFKQSTQIPETYLDRYIDNAFSYWNQNNSPINVSEGSLLYESGYSYSELCDIINKGKLKELLLEVDTEYHLLKDRAETGNEKAPEELRYLVGFMMTIHDKLTEMGYGECGKISYLKGDSVVVITRTEKGIQYSSYKRCDI